MKKLTTKEFIERARNIHANKYDYSKVKYVDSKTKVCIICPVHGEFWQSPNCHLSGKGCHLCSKPIHDTKSFIQKAKKVHNDKYDYSKVNYINAKTKVCIICPVHGEFWQSPDKHLQGNGCQKCAKNIQYTTVTFIEQARKVHGDKYDYSKVEYINNHTKVCIIDKEIGEFWQLPANHLKGCGCHLNHGKRVWDTRGRITTDDFIKQAKKIHGDKYDYSLVEYKGMEEKVEIICKKCGRHFLQKASNHVHLMQGCPFCLQSKLELEVDKILEDKKIIFERQKRFSWLGRQSLDFYLPEYNVAIECQGEQHYIPVDFAGRGKNWANDNLKKIQRRDKLKKKLCENNGVTILYYSIYNKDIKI